jgi:flagellin-specific chaperone FliS
MLFYLTEANLHRDAKRVGKVIELLDTIYSAYKEIIEGEKKTVSQTEKAAEVTEAIRRVQISL